ncbi:MAG: DUF1552 domain-containing protein [Oligoflexus sp.]|jgi:hypothetical protein
MNDQKLQFLSRRSLIKSIGGLTVSWPLLRSIAHAQAAGETGPLKRLVLVCGESGGSGYWWRPQGGETNFDLEFDGAILKPLAPLRNKLLILNGVGNYALAFRGTESHEARSVTFTAYANSKSGDPNFARGPSVDRGIIERLGEARPLYATIGAPSIGTGSEYYYARPGYPIAGVGTSTGIFDALFSNTPTSPSENATLTPTQLFQKTMWEQQMEDAKVLRTRLGPDARLKLDEYLATLNEKLEAFKNQPMPPNRIPPRPVNPDYNQTIDVRGPYDRYTRDLDLVADGLILGTTQVACLKVAHWVMEDSFLGQRIETYDDSGRSQGNMTITDYHQHVAHAQFVEDRLRSAAPNIIGRDVHRAIAIVMARFLQRLESARERDGSSVLDHTLVVWTTQLGDQSSHLGGRLPYVLAGGLGERVGTFRMGRFLDYAPGGISGYEELKAVNCAVAQHQLLNSVQRTFGIEQDVFGENLNPARCRGYLPRAT